jgi:hypothetical protein
MDILAQKPNTYQGSVVKRTDGCIAGAEWPSVEQIVKRLVPSDRG